MKPRWDPQKAEENWRKHGVSFKEAGLVFLDPFIVVAFDRDRSNDEDRYFAIGQSNQRLLAVAYTIRGGEPWIITARIPEPREKRRYMRGDELRDRPRDENENDPTAHLDWAHAVRGLHYIPPPAPITVEIEPKLVTVFRNAREVNEALWLLVQEGRIGPEDADGHRQFPFGPPRAR